MNEYNDQPVINLLNLSTCQLSTVNMSTCQSINLSTINRSTCDHKTYPNKNKSHGARSPETHRRLQSRTIIAITIYTRRLHLFLRRPFSRVSSLLATFVLLETFTPTPTPTASSRHIVPVICKRCHGNSPQEVIESIAKCCQEKKRTKYCTVTRKR